MRALITGGCGFVGSHLAEHLLRRGYAVDILDDLSTGRRTNVEHLERAGQLTVVIGSVTDSIRLDPLIDKADVVFHLAAAVGVKKIMDEPVATLEINVAGTENVLRRAKVRGTKVIVASTSEVYGKSTSVPFSEEGDLVLGATSRRRWGYACSKALDEFLALAYAKEYGLPVVVVRLFNTVGPRQTGQYGMVVPTFVRQALAGEPLTVFGDGTQQRCFTHVVDVAEALCRLAEAPAAVGRVFNIGSSEEISILALAERVIETVGSASPITQIAYETAFDQGFEDMPRRVPDVTRLRETIGMVPMRGLTEILDDVIAEHRQQLHHAVAGGEGGR